MKNNFIKKIMALSIISISSLGICSVGASAEWVEQDTHMLYMKDYKYLTGWQVIDGNKYYFNENGYRAYNGWIYVDGRYYYANEYGIIQHDTTISGWTVGSDGGRIDNSNASMSNGWTQSIDGTWTYNKADGTKATGWLMDSDGKTYYLNTQGTMMANTWINDGGKWYYCYPNGSIAKNTNINGYQIDNNGVWTQNNTVNNNTTNNINSGNTTSNTTNNGVINNGGINTNIVNNNIDNSTNTTNIMINDNNDKKEASKISKKLKDYTNKESDKKLSALKEELALWEKDNSTFAKGNIDKLHKSIDEIENDKKYDKMSTSEQRISLIADKNAEISKLKSELEQWKKDDSIESKKRQYDIQQEIKDAEDYIDLIS